MPTVDPQVLVGKPVVKGTRLAVEFIVDLLAQGWSEADILRNYPRLTHQDIQACLAYASAILRCPSRTSRTRWPAMARESAASPSNTPDRARTSRSGA